MSQCSERVKHALSPPFVSSGLFSSPAPAGRGSRALRPFAADAKGWAPAAKQRLFRAGNGIPHSIRPSPCRPALPDTSAWKQTGKAGNIYAATVTVYIASPATDIGGLPSPPRFRSEVQGFGAPPRIRPSLADSQCRPSFDHQKHTNWSQIMHESPQSARFSGLHCNVRIGDILLCLFLF